MIIPHAGHLTGNIAWSKDSKSIFFQYTEHGDIHLAVSDLEGNYKDLETDLGGLFYIRPYSEGTFSVSPNGNYAYSKL